jgi:uncharacterized membrane protein
MESWIIISLIALLLIVGLAVFILKKDKTYEPDYRVFFIIGITWLPLGIATDNTAFLAMGAIFMVLGLANRDKWKEQENFSEMNPDKRRFKIILIVGLTLLLLIGAAAYFLAR